MAAPTKSDLEATIVRLQEQIEDLKARLNEKNAALKETSNDGFIVTTPNSRYVGNTAGITFVNGVAFVPKEGNYKKVLVELVGDFGYSIKPASAREYKDLVSDVEEVDDDTLTLEEIMSL